MPDQNKTQPTILVKKTDGTFARMTLDEIKKMKGGDNKEKKQPVAPSAPVSVSKNSLKTASSVPTVPAVENDNRPVDSRLRGNDSETAVIPELVGDPSPVRQPLDSRLRGNDSEMGVIPDQDRGSSRQFANTVDSHLRGNDSDVSVDSRLRGNDSEVREDSRPRSSQGQALRGNNGGVQKDIKPKDEEEILAPLNPPPQFKPSAPISKVDEIISRLTFHVSPEYSNRLRSVAQLRLKDVRDDFQTTEVCRRALKDGGLGLTAEQTAELLRQLKKEMLSSSPLVKNDQPKNVSRVSSQPTAAIPTVKRTQPTAPAQYSEIPKMREQNILKNNSSSRTASAPSYTTPSARNAVQDVISRPTRMGPLDEIKYFNIVDFRRLSSDAQEAATRLKQKFLNLKEESYLLYWDAMEKWRESPLFMDYMKIVEDALLRREKISAAADKNKIQPEEINAIVQMERELSQ